MPCWLAWLARTGLAIGWLCVAVALTVLIVGLTEESCS